MNINIVHIVKTHSFKLKWMPVLEICPLFHWLSASAPSKKRLSFCSQLLGALFPVVQEPVFRAGVSDQCLSTTLDQNVALLIGLCQNTELGVCKKHLNYIMLSSFRKLHHLFSSWVLQHVKFVILINNFCPCFDVDIWWYDSIQI